MMIDGYKCRLVHINNPPTPKGIGLVISNVEFWIVPLEDNNPPQVFCRLPASLLPPESLEEEELTEKWLLMAEEQNEGLYTLARALARIKVDGNKLFCPFWPDPSLKTAS